jgi:3'(2'), 5'-bisphosphate nucleotidase
MKGLMDLMSPELKQVEALARLGGNTAMRHYGGVTAEYKAANSPVTAADREANENLVAGLQALFPGDPILSEESADSHRRLTAKRVWIVDPLDGTKEFLAQNGEFSVMIGLVEDGRPVLGVVYLPALNILYSAELGGGATVERMGVRSRLECTYVNGGPLRMVASRSHADPILEQIQQSLHIHDVQPSGSVGIKCALIAENERDLYIHPGPYLKEWDTCAPEIILREAGGDVVDCTGAPLTYNKLVPVQTHGIVACAPGALPRVLAALRPLYAQKAEPEPA